MYFTRTPTAFHDVYLSVDVAPRFYLIISAYLQPTYSATIHVSRSSCGSSFLYSMRSICGCSSCTRQPHRVQNVTPLVGPLWVTGDSQPGLASTALLQLPQPHCFDTPTPIHTLTYTSAARCSTGTTVCTCNEQEWQRYAHVFTHTHIHICVYICVQGVPWITKKRRNSLCTLIRLWLQFAYIVKCDLWTQVFLLGLSEFWCDTTSQSIFDSFTYWAGLQEGLGNACVCMCVCVCVRKKERDRDREWEGDRQSKRERVQEKELERARGMKKEKKGERGGRGV